MARTMINIKADQEVKKNAQKLAHELGLSLSDVINASLRNFIRTREVRISAIPQMTPELEKFLGVVEKDLRAKKNLSTGLKNTEDILRYLDSL